MTQETRKFEIPDNPTETASNAGAWLILFILAAAALALGLGL